MAVDFVVKAVDGRDPRTPYTSAIADRGANSQKLSGANTRSSTAIETKRGERCQSHRQINDPDFHNFVSNKILA